MMLINALLTHASDARWDEFIGELERLNVRKAVVRLMKLHEIEDLTSCILDFQANILRVTHRKKITPVDPAVDSSHARALKTIWEKSKVGEMEEELDQHGQPIQWRKLGFETEDLGYEFRDCGVLGLECLCRFVEVDSDFAMVSELFLPLHIR